MHNKKIIIRGAREHNLKNIDLEIPRDKLVVITGISGSGKSSLAFDTIYAEGQRRYVESLSAYARQFMEQMQKPDVDSIEGLSPAISIEQKTTSKNPRSTVGTVTEIYDYLRLLFARVGHPHCHQCGKEIAAQTVQQIVDQVMELPAGSKIQVLAPVVRGRKGEYKKVFYDLGKAGFLRVRVNGKLRELTEEIELDKNKKHNIDVVVDRLIIKPELERRLADSVEMALKLAEGIIIINVLEETRDSGLGIRDSGLKTVDSELGIGDSRKDKKEQKNEPRTPNPEPRNYDLLFSEKMACIDCGISLPEMTPRMFSFNNPHGACPACGGLGTRLDMPTATVVPEGSAFFKWMSPQYLQRRYLETQSARLREDIETYVERLLTTRPCPDCHGARLRQESLAVRINGNSIYDYCRLSVKEALKVFSHLPLSPREQEIARRILKEIRERLGFLVNVGLDYLSLDRAAATLSGGEGQRIRLATQIGSSLVGVLYILDEPSIGLHQRDNKRLLNTLKNLRDLGNTVLVVEHDEETIRSADYVVDLGPGAGVWGGQVVAKGTPEEVIHNPQSLTGKYLSRELKIPLPRQRRSPNRRLLKILGARQHNLKNISATIPLGLFVCVTGVSGSGKSSLITETLYKALAQRLYRSSLRAGSFDSIEGLEYIDKVINIDQAPIGRTPRSNPATYTGLFSFIRELYALVPEAKVRGYKPGRFSFNVKGGRCEACEGDGILKIEMHFLPDIYITCETCQGQRYNRETLDIKYKSKNIAQVLDMTVSEALNFFQHIPSLSHKLQTLYDVGLGYIKLGQSATTLSGGEAQRVKLSRELGKRATGRTLYILDEPTTGLHFADIQQLLEVLHELAAKGNTVVVIEHNLDVIKTADHVIDLGPEGGDEGGYIVATGTPEEVMKVPESYTGQFLKKVLNSGDKKQVAVGSRQ